MSPIRGIHRHGEKQSCQTISRERIIDVKNISGILIVFALVLNYGCTAGNIVKEPVFKGRLIDFGILDAYGSTVRRDNGTEISCTYYDPTSQFSVYSTDTIPLQKNIHFGIVTTLVIISHEIPQEIGDFGVLVYGGFTKFKALYYNFIIALTCVLGTIAGYFISVHVKEFSVFLLPFTAGGFIYIGACDLVPELHKQPDLKKSASSMLAFLCGIIFILLARMIGSH